MGHDTLPVEESTGTTEVEQLKTELEAVKEELRSVKTEFHNYRKAVSKKFSGHEEELEELEARFEGHDPKGGDGENGSQSGDLLPIERLMKLRETDNQHPALPTNGRASFDRSATIFENFKKWSKKSPKGRTITDGIKTLLETATGERLAWRQVYRAMDAIEKWTQGAIAHKTTNRHGHILIMEERSSSAGGGG